MTVRNWRTPLIEKFQYITPDGIVYELHDPPVRAVMFYEGDGLAKATFDTRAGPFQHGQTVSSYRLKSRQIDVVIRHQGCSREDYLEKRVGLSNILRHSRTDDNNPQPGQLRRYFADGTVRDLDVFLEVPPIYKWPGDWDHWAVHETLQFTAYNPVMYDPTLYTATQVDFATDPPLYTNLSFPIRFPIFFGSLYYVSVTKSFTINYAGNWEEYPTIIITGPAKDPSISHSETGDTISLSGYSLGLGETVTIDLSYGEKTIVNNAGVSLLGYVTDTSNLTRFRLLPDPQVAGGVNTILATMSLGTIDSRVDVRYRHRYQGK